MPARCWIAPGDARAPGEDDDGSGEFGPVALGDIAAHVAALAGILGTKQPPISPRRAGTVAGLIWAVLADTQNEKTLPEKRDDSLIVLGLRCTRACKYLAIK
mgnify:CR=1 FL=1